MESEDGHYVDSYTNDLCLVRIYNRNELVCVALNKSSFLCVSTDMIMMMSLRSCVGG